MKFAAASDRGRVRQLNEDCCEAFDLGYPEKPLCFIIADGMGGHNAGEMASRMAVDCVRSLLTKKTDEMTAQPDSICSKIDAVFKQANDEIYRAALKNDKYSGMGTTIIAAVIYNKHIYIGHVGDSRAYLVRNGAILQITEDHSFVEALIKNGTITKAEAENHPNRHAITRALGVEAEVAVDSYDYEMLTGDYVVLCTDGLSNMISDDEILKCTMAGQNPEQTCAALIEEANSRGGSDNVSVIVVNSQS